MLEIIHSLHKFNGRPEPQSSCLLSKGASQNEMVKMFWPSEKFGDGYKSFDLE